MVITIYQSPLPAMDLTFILTAIFLLLAAWFAWRYYKLRRNVDEFASRVREQDTLTDVKELENSPAPSPCSFPPSTFTTQPWKPSAPASRTCSNSSPTACSSPTRRVSSNSRIPPPAGSFKTPSPSTAVSPKSSATTSLSKRGGVAANAPDAERDRRSAHPPPIPATRRRPRPAIERKPAPGPGPDPHPPPRDRARDFISNLSHELRTPLAFLKALTETLQDGALDDPPAARHFIDQIQIETDALTQMVTELLELSRIESGASPST